MAWEVSYADNINDFFLAEGLKEQDLIKLKVKMDHVAQSPFILSEAVLGLNASLGSIRRVRYRDHRMFVLLDPTGEILHCLAFMHRRHCYDKKNLDRIATIARSFMNSKPR